MRMPQPVKGNLLFLRIMADCQFSRDINGNIDFNVFIRVLDLYGEVIGIDSFDKIYLLRKAQYVMGIETEKRKADSPTSPKGPGNRPALIGGRKR